MHAVMPGSSPCGSVVGATLSERCIRYRATRWGPHIVRSAVQQGEQAGPILLRSKVVVPTLGYEHLSRPRLLAALEAGASRRLTLVVAPAGYGKTRLLAEWCRSTAAAHPSAWLSLDEHDND